MAEGKGGNILKILCLFQFLEGEGEERDDEHIRKANRDWRRKNHPTDVVTMSSYVPGHKPRIVRILMLGSILVSLETAASWTNGGKRSH
ncbi:hypothetical protein MTR_1g007290 [Medicago truncatula]|uniref:Uncharacterized protein n=1 Tax=Medicago truncatula TaxID=3880 RepID=G7I275_MEDTR|nr:hypothetical protein MTR_1g007290 [Medicago truncatula]